MRYFLDTSSLVKIYHQESGSPKVIEFYNSDSTICLSDLARIEFRATIYRKYRDGELSENTLQILEDKFGQDCEIRYEVYKFSSLVIDDAGRLLQEVAKEHALRTLDCLQLAFFRVYCEKSDIFVCSDIRLAEAARLKKYKTIAP